MAKPELGQKQVCPNCQAKFYDLGRRPAHCPKCATEFDPEEALKLRNRRGRPGGYPADDEAEDQVKDKKVDGDEDDDGDGTSDDGGTSDEVDDTAASANEDENDNTSNIMPKTAKKTSTAAGTKKAASTKTGGRKSTRETISTPLRRRNGAPWPRST